MLPKPNQVAVLPKLDQVVVVFPKTATEIKMRKQIIIMKIISQPSLKIIPDTNPGLLGESPVGPIHPPQPPFPMYFGLFIRHHLTF